MDAALENRDAIHRQVKKYYFLANLGYQSLLPPQVCAAVETIGEIAAGGGSRGGLVGRGEQAGEEEAEEKGLLDLLIEARMLLQVNKKLPIISSFCLC